MITAKQLGALLFTIHSHDEKGKIIYREEHLIQLLTLIGLPNPVFGEAMSFSQYENIKKEESQHDDNLKTKITDILIDDLTQSHKRSLTINDKTVESILAECREFDKKENLQKQEDAFYAGRTIDESLWRGASILKTFTYKTFEDFTNK